MTSVTRDLIDSLVLAMEQRSSDPDTQVGCVITNRDGHILATGANHHTAGVQPDGKNDQRPEKYDWIEHAERNAIFSAARRGVALSGSVMYLPGFPCVECARAIAQSGISLLFHGSTEGWDEERYKFSKSRKILEQAGVTLVERDVEKSARGEVFFTGGTVSGRMPHDKPNGPDPFRDQSLDFKAAAHIA